MEIEVGKCYLRKKGTFAVIRQVKAIENGKVTYNILHGCQRLMKNRFHHTSSLKNFRKWAMREVEETNDYSHYDGATIHPTYLVHSVAGKPLFRCQHKRAQFYLRRGFAKMIDDHNMQFTDETTEKKLIELYGTNDLGEFFMAVKNDRCGVCDKRHALSRHHVVPQREVDRLPLEWKQFISNVLFICLECHKRYEVITFEQKFSPPSDDPEQFISAWRDHFMETMKPQHLPEGWNIFTKKLNRKEDLVV